MSWQEILVRLLFAFVLGSAIGIEKKWYQTRQNIQSNAQIALGAAMFSILAISVDKTESASELTLGISLLCAGFFFQQRPRYSPAENLNIIVKLWCAGAVGSLVGYGLFFPAYIAILIIFITNLLFPTSEKSLNLIEEETTDDLQKPEIKSISPQKVYYQCQVNCSTVDEAEVIALLVQLGKEQQLTPIKISSGNLDNNSSSPEIEIQISFVCDGNSSPPQLHQMLVNLKSKLKVRSASWLEIGQNNRPSSTPELNNPGNRAL